MCSGFLHFSALSPLSYFPLLQPTTALPVHEIPDLLLSQASVSLVLSIWPTLPPYVDQTHSFVHFRPLFQYHLLSEAFLTTPFNTGTPILNSPTSCLALFLSMAFSIIWHRIYFHYLFVLSVCPCKKKSSISTETFVFHSLLFPNNGTQKMLNKYFQTR